MKHLRHPSPRPGVVVDPANFGIGDPTNRTVVGPQGPFGRERVLTALPFTPEPSLLAPPTCVFDGVAYLADPDNNLIGTPAVWVQRMLTARWTEDTRRF